MTARTRSFSPRPVPWRGGWTRTIGLTVVLGGLGSVVSGGQLPPPPDRGPQAPQALQGSRSANRDVQVRTSLSRTAIWVGDPVEFVVELTCGPKLDVLTDDLTKEKLKLEGLDVVADSNEREDTPDGGVRRRFRYQLTTYDTEAPPLVLPVNTHW